MTNTKNKTNLLNLNRADLVDFFVKMGEKPFRAQQLIKWIHQLGVTDFAAMTNMSLALREYLALHALVSPPETVVEQVSQDGTRKWLFKLEDGNLIETVYIPEDDRGTLCISSQVGCALGCAFCATGKMGFKRNLTLAEIIGQLWVVVRQLSCDRSTKDHVVTNVVFMGMGEPLLNFDNVIKALDLMLDDLAYGLSKYRVTISTSGIVPEMKRLRAISKAALAISLHAPTDELRSKLMPINKKYPLQDIVAVCKDYYQDEPRRVVTVEYILLAGVNDSREQAVQLACLLRGVPCKVNLIPFNNAGDSVASCYRVPKQVDIDAFRGILIAAGINTVTRKSRGADIAAACGQLAGKEERKNE